VCLSVLFVCVFVTQGSHAQGTHGNMAIIHPGESLESIVAKAANVVPTPRQLAWQEREFIAFAHFGMNTFTDREWGDGTESPALFNPTALDARQWARVVRDAGMKMIIVTAKHHDGFCLWPTRYTEHCVRNSPWRGGKGDVVREVASACKEFGLKFGVYLSPWDRHEPSYGDSPTYNEHFRNQLRELLTNYGIVDEVWFDGACGEGPNGKRQVYDWQMYYKTIRQLQPQAVIAIMGPDVRWVGTETGVGRETEWSVLPDIARNVDSIAAHSQQNPVDGAFSPGDLTQPDLGSREKLRTAKTLAWYPAETDVSIRPGWFYHTTDDSLVKTPDQLVNVYYSSVGRNGQLLLNIPPDRRGLIHENDVKGLMAMRKILDGTFAVNICANAKVKATSAQAGHPAVQACDRDNRTYWMAAEGTVAPTLEYTFPAEKTFDCLLLQERITVGQRIEKFRLEAWSGSGWREVVVGTTVGYKRLIRFPAVTASRVRLVIDGSRTSPALSTVGLFKTP
jgi:alpha-L-fucosidase